MPPVCTVPSTNPTPGTEACVLYTLCCCSGASVLTALKKTVNHSQAFRPAGKNSKQKFYRASRAYCNTACYCMRHSLKAGRLFSRCLPLMLVPVTQVVLPGSAKVGAKLSYLTIRHAAALSLYIYGDLGHIHIHLWLGTSGSSG